MVDTGVTVEESIQTALFNRVRDLDPDIFPAAAKAWPDVSFKPGALPYLQISLLPNETERVFIKGRAPHIYRGILNMIVIAPLNLGAQEPTRLAGLIANEFQADLTLYDSVHQLRIEKAPDVYPARAEEATWRVLISVRYECIAMPGLSPAGYSLDFTKTRNSKYAPLI